MRLRLFIDGASKGNPGPGGAGILVQDAHGRRLKQYCKFLPRCTNNAAEAEALELALVAARRLGGTRLEVFTDSQLLARQWTGQYRVRDAGLRERWERIRALAGGFEEVAVAHIPREQNAEADALANLAVTRGLEASPRHG